MGGKDQGGTTEKKREVRLSESRLLREKYLEKYSWEELIRSLVKRLNSLAFGKRVSASVFGENRFCKETEFTFSDT